MTVEANAKAIDSLEPAAVWQFFAGLSAVPRPSKQEERIRAHVKQVAERHSLAVREDAVGNLLIDVKATPGHEKAPITVLQAHLDMVCEKNTGTVHDFNRDPIRLIREKESDTGKTIIRADGTTLGADNGIGAAMALAVATSPDVVHGPLELLFTTDEEAGMTGAKALSPETFRGRRMLNLDSEEDDAIYIGCAGGVDVNLTWDFQTSPCAGEVETARVVVSGLRGGHSGGDIHEGRGNAIKLLARTLSHVDPEALRLCRITGGSKRNAIPREASAYIAGPKGIVHALFEAGKIVSAEAERESGEHQHSIHVENVAPDEVPVVLSARDSQRLLEALSGIPSGVMGMHPAVPGLVETSNNLATIATKMPEPQTTVVQVCTLARSSASSRMREAVEQISAVGRLAGAKVETGNDYPGWEPNVDSPTLATCRRIYKALFGAEPTVAAIHAGLECGIIGQRVGEMDMISIGPCILGAHSPDERIYVDSVPKSWKFLLAILADLAKG